MAAEDVGCDNVGREDMLPKPLLCSATVNWLECISGRADDVREDEVQRPKIGCGGAATRSDDDVGGRDSSGLEGGRRKGAGILWEDEGSS